MILTGARASGKTTWILALVDRLKQLGKPVYGVATPKHFNGSILSGIKVRDVRTGEEKILAARDDEPGVRIGPWRFLGEGIRFANRICEPKDCPGLTIIDEIGPLELSGLGFATAFESLKQGRYEKAIVVVRPDLVEEIGTLITGRTTIHYIDDDMDAVLRELDQL